MPTTRAHWCTAHLPKALLGHCYLYFLDSWGMNRWIMWCHPLLKGFLVHRRSETYIATFLRRKTWIFKMKKGLIVRTELCSQKGDFGERQDCVCRWHGMCYSQIYFWDPVILHHTCTLMSLLIMIFIKEIFFYYVKFYIFKHVLIVINL